MGKLLTGATVEERREIANVIYQRVVDGERLNDIARELDEHPISLFHMVKQLGPGPLPKIEPEQRRPRRQRMLKDRDDLIARSYLFSRRATMPALAEQHGLTKQRIKMIVDRYLQEQTGQPGAEKLGRTRKQRFLALGKNAQTAAR